MDYNVIRHLEMLQVVISRMAANSYILKGWTVTIVAGNFILSSTDSSWELFFITYLPILFFWSLDSFYLLQE